MNVKFYPLNGLLMAILLCCLGTGVRAQVLTLTKAVKNQTTLGNGTLASQDDILVYTIQITSQSASNFTNTKLYDNMPAGVAYIAGSTTLNGSAAADVSGKMPFASSGGLINSPTYGAGIVAPNTTVTVVFKVKVTANGGSVANYATVDGNYNTISYVQTTNTVTTNINVDPNCNTVWESTPDGDGNYRYVNSINTSTGASNAAIYKGSSTDPEEGLSRDAFSGAWFANGTAFGSDPTTSVAALAYEKSSDRLYFINNDNNPQPYLSFIDSITTSTPPFTAKVLTGKNLETNTGSGYNINRMCFGSDGYGYALTSNCKDLIRFTVNRFTNATTITRLGTLKNDAVNGSVDVLSEGGGDIFADGSGKIYMIVNSSRLYKINPSTRVATYMGKVTPNFTGSEPSQSMAIDAAGNVYIGGAYSTVYKLDLGTMVRTALPTTNQPFSGDFASCGFPVLSSTIVADKTFSNINGSSTVVGGDTVEYKITVRNIGNFNAAGVKLYDYIPPGTSYLPNTTYLNDVFVADVSGVMPYAVAGGRLVNSPGESGGIIKPDVANQAVVTFQVKTEPLKQVCNQSKITLLDADGNIIFVNSSDGTPGTTPTCFFVDIVILPLNDLKFKGNLNNDKSVLQWSMKEDEGLAYYEIEYSENGTSWSTVGKIAAKGNTTAVNNYQFTDMEHVFSTVRFYRLKVTKKDETFNYSGIITINVKGITGMQVIPNPFLRELNVQIQLNSAETVRLQVVDTYGRPVYSTTEQLSGGSNSVSVHLPASLPKGVYVLKAIVGKEQLYQTKLLKK